MKALVYTGVEQLEIRQVADPVCKEGDALIKIMASGICGSDMHAFLGHDERRPAPLILGHEAAGVIVGGEMDGRRVTINPLVCCGTCPACRSGRTNICGSRQIISMPPREGAFAEYVAMPVENLVTVPDHVPFEKAAMTEPLACGWHGIRLGLGAIPMEAGEVNCVVIGGGAIGVGAALAAHAFGVKSVKVIEPNELRRTRLKDIEEFTALGSNEVDVQMVGVADLVIDAVGYAVTRKSASSIIAKPGGAIVHIGLGENEGGLNIRRMTLQEITFIGTYTYTADDFRATAQAIFDGRLGALDWFEKWSLEDGQQAFTDIRAGKIASPKIILDPTT